MRNKALVTLFAVALASLALGGGRAVADPDSNGGTSGLTDPTLLALITNDDVFATADLSVLLSGPFGNGTQHYGGYPSSSPDTGSCPSRGRPPAPSRRVPVARPRRPTRR